MGGNIFLREILVVLYIACHAISIIYQVTDVSACFPKIMFSYKLAK